MKVNKAQLADVLGISETALTDWQKEEPPLPMVRQAGRRGQANTYDTAEVIEWMVDRRMRLSGTVSDRDRLYRLQAEEVALRISEKRGELVSVTQLEPELQRMVATFRARLLEIPDALASDLESMPADLSAWCIELEQRLHAAMHELAAYDPEAKAPVDATARAGASA